MARDWYQFIILYSPDVVVELLLLYAIISTEEIMFSTRLAGSSVC